MQLTARVVLWLHVTLYRLTNGRIGGRFIAGSSILLLTTTGRRTGKRRTRPLAYVRDGERYVLCASNGGSPTHPGWYHNLTATGRNASIPPLTLALAVVACRLLPPGCKAFAACSPPAGSVTAAGMDLELVSLLRGS
jgi:F420H(2)-dependent quinone reductase